MLTLHLCYRQRAYRRLLQQRLTMEITNSVLLLQPGIYILRHPNEGQPPITISRAPGDPAHNGRIEALWTPGTLGATLRDGSDCIVMHVQDAPAELLVSAFAKVPGTGAPPALRIDKIDLDPAPGTTTAAAQPAQAAPLIGAPARPDATASSTGTATPGMASAAGQPEAAAAEAVQAAGAAVAPGATGNATSTPAGAAAANDAAGATVEPEASGTTSTTAPGAATAGTAPAMPAADPAERKFFISDQGVSLVGHIERVGDAVATEGAYLGDPEGSLRLEGFLAVWPDRPHNVDLAYNAVVEGLGLTATTGTGHYCGSKGESRRIREVTFALIGAGAAQFALEGSAHFSGGFSAPISSGVTIKGPEHGHLTALRLVAVPVIGENPWEQRPRAKVFGIKRPAK